MNTNLFTFIKAVRLAAGRWLAIAVLLCAEARAAEPTFTNVTATVTPGLPQVAYSSMAWGDYDNDGRLDFLLTGQSFTNIHSDGSSDTDVTSISQIWRNTGSGFTNVTDTVAPGLPQVGYGCSVAWGDFDNDGRLDFLLTGYGGYTTNGQLILVSQIWRNTGTGFTNVTASVAPGLPGVRDSSVAWGDYDHDGHLDFLITGRANDESFVSQLWRNTGSGFTNVTDRVAPNLPGVVAGSVAWGDYDSDGRLDFLLTGGIPYDDGYHDDLPDWGPVSQLWRNTGSGFVNVTDTVVPGLPGVYWGSVAWGDYDSDGRLDLLLSGWNRPTYRGLCQLWRNTGNGFVNVTATVALGLPKLQHSAVAWGDYDNDGRLDFLASGFDDSGRGDVSQIWRNTGSGFENVTASVAPGLPGVDSGSVAWGDYDSDGRLDFLLTGAIYGFCDVCDGPVTFSQLWRNNTAEANPPAVITELPAVVSPASVTLNGRINLLGDAASAWFIWGDSTNHGNATAAQPMGNGNSFTNFSATITGLSTGVTYFYRAVGSNDQGRVFLGFEQHFLLAAPAVTTIPAGNLTPTFATVRGHVSPDSFTTYAWFEWGRTPAFGQVTPVQFLGVGFGTGYSQHLPDLEGGTTYYFRSVASNVLGVTYGAMQSFVTPTFANVTGTIAGELSQVGYSAAAWGDYDNDGRLDFILTGFRFHGEDESSFFEIWRNTAAGFANVTATVAPDLHGAFSRTVTWGDYDNDGRLDLFITPGQFGTGHSLAQVWRNTGVGFANVTALVAPGLPRDGSGAWGDYDNDGRLDLLVTGYDDGDVLVSQLWRNTGSGFTNVTASAVTGLPGIAGSAVAWGDYDNDGRLDFLVTGATNGGPSGRIAQLWRNTGSGFANVTSTVAPGLPGVEFASMAWGDYDNDGRLDFLLTGHSGYSSNGFGIIISQLWRNTGHGFVNVTDTVAPGLPAVYGGSVAWGDYDNDGRLDFLITGDTSNWTSRVAQVWRNTESGFENVTAIVAPGLPDIAESSVAWSDYNNDGRLDFLITGDTYGPSDFVSQIWRNYTPLTNTPPRAPTGLAMTATTSAVMLSWNSAMDGQTPASGLTYNVRAGTTPGGVDLLSAHVNATNGFRRVLALGNAMLRHSLPLIGLTNVTNGQTVYWSVQAVDTALAGGPFATETSVVSLPALSVSLNAQPSTLNLSWTPPTFGWVLQQSPNLSVSNWTTAASDSANPATFPATNGAMFYRLSKQ